jgi:two-component system OmpR family response regulator
MGAQVVLNHFSTMSGVPTKKTTAKKRVLIADDDPAISRLLERVLMREYEVIIAKDGPGALALAQETRPNLLILDVMMPGMDGFQLAAKVREVPEIKNSPIIFLTARDGPMDTIKGIQSGARHYLTKPFKIDDLLTKVKKILG